MASRDPQRNQLGRAIRRAASLAALSAALFAQDVVGIAPSASAAPIQVVAETPSEECGRRTLAIENADATQRAALITDLAAWITRLESSTFAGSAPDPDAVWALYEGSLFLADRPEQLASREAWIALSARATEALPAGDERLYYATARLLTLAQNALNRRDFQGARAWVDRALAEEPHPLVEPDLLHVLAELERCAGAKLAALKTLERADACVERIGPENQQWNRLRGQSELLRAQTCLDLGLPDLAWAALQRCKEEARLAKNKSQLENANLIEIDLLLATSRAAEVVERLRPRAPKPGEPPAAPLSRRLQLCLALALADPECLAAGLGAEAIAALDGLLASGVLEPDEARNAHVALVDCHLRGGNLALAREHLDAARRELDRWKTRAEGEVVAREQVEIEAYAAHLLRAQSFEPAAGELQLVRLREAFDAFLDQLQRNDRPRGGVGFLHFARRRFVLNELIQLSLAVQGPERGFESALAALVQAQELGSLSRALSDAPASVDDVRRALCRESGGVLVFLPDSYRTLVLAFDAKRASLCELAAPKSEWQPAVEAWVRELTHSPALLDEPARARNREALERCGAQVAKLLLPTKIRERLALWKGLTIVGADLLNDLPIEGLPFDGGTTLGLRFALDRAPSLPVAAKLAERRAEPSKPLPGARGGLWLVAAPLQPEWSGEAQRRLPRIPFEPADELALRRPYGDLDGASFLGTRATREALLDPRIASASVLQITAHGIEIAGKERPAAIVLRPASRADDGLLDCDEVERLQGIPDTVALIACGAARGEQRYGEDGLNHLGGAFLKAGASCVLLSSHTVDAEAMQALMEVFHQRLCAGDSRAEALRQARVSVARNPRWSHPYYHALVFQVGLGQYAR